MYCHFGVSPVNYSDSDSELMHQSFVSPAPFGAGDTRDIAGLKCRNLTSDVSRQCGGCAGVLNPR